MSMSLLSCVCLEPEEEEEDQRHHMEDLGCPRTARKDRQEEREREASSSLASSECRREEGGARKPAKRLKDKVMIFTGALGSRDCCEEDWDMLMEDEGVSSDEDDGFEYQSDGIFDASVRKEFNWKWPKDFEPMESILQDTVKLDKITEVQRQIGTAQKNYVKLAKNTNFSLDKSMIVRYLEAHLWEIEGVAENIMETIDWRVSFGLPKIDRALLRGELETGKFFCQGKARDGRPLVYLLLGKENTWSANGNTAAVIYTLERALSSMQKDVQEAVYIIDCQNVGVMTAPSTGFVSQLITVLGRHYPRRLGQLFICNVSSVFYFIWNVVSLTLKEMTVKKIQILTSDVDEMRTRIGEYVAPDNFHVDYGGEADFNFDVDTYLQAHKGLLK